MTTYLLLKSADYTSALRQATKMMGNRGFDIYGSDDLEEREKERAITYLDQACRYCLSFLLPSVQGQMDRLKALDSPNHDIYLSCAQGVEEIESILTNHDFKEVAFQDPRHLFLMASSKKYPRVFHGYRGAAMDVPPDWQSPALREALSAQSVPVVRCDNGDRE